MITMAILMLVEMVGMSTRMVDTRIVIQKLLLLPIEAMDMHTVVQNQIMVIVTVLIHIHLLFYYRLLHIHDGLLLQMVTLVV